MAELPKISITTPSYNQSAYLEQTILSVLTQTGVEVEYLICDGGSTDDSVEIIQRYADKLAYWVSEPDGGQTAAIVKGWKRATGDILSWLNSDDYLLPNSLRQVRDAFRADPDLLVVIGSGAIVTPQAQVIGDKYARHFNLETLLTTGGGVPHQPSTFIHRRVIEMVGYPNPALNYVMDWEYWIRIALAVPSSRVKLIYKPLSALRVWDGTKTLTGVEKICSEHRAVLQQIFASGTLPPHLQKLEARSMAGTYIKQAFLQWQSGQANKARISLATAKEIDPSVLVGWHEMKLHLQTHLPFPLYEKARRVWGKLRPLLANP